MILFTKIDIIIDNRIYKQLTPLSHETLYLLPSYCTHQCAVL